MEGIGLYKTDKPRGFLVISSQGNDTYAVYERQGNNSHIGSFQIADNAQMNIDGASEADGLAVTNKSLGEKFPDGMLVVQDGQNTRPEENQNFKYVSWREISRALRIK